MLYDAIYCVAISVTWGAAARPVIENCENTVKEQERERVRRAVSAQIL